MDDYRKQLESFLQLTAEKGGSDLHLSPGYYPTLRIDGRLAPMTNYPILDKNLLAGMVFSFISETQKEKFLKDKEIDFSYEYNQSIRCRVHVYQSKGNFALVFRFIARDIPTLEQLNLPATMRIFSKLSQGFVLVVAPNGHGKSTTLAALIDLINHERAEKIVTIEDPVEYIFTPDRSIIDQRELHTDTLSFNNALRSTSRENVNVIMIGEMRDYETMNAAINAAETGHLVFASLHTNSAAQTVERIIQSFSSQQQPLIINQLANTLSGVISQRLIPRIKGGLIPAVELMIATTAVRNAIRENQVQQLNLAIDTGADIGMISLDRSLADLVKNREISMEQAEFYSLNPMQLRSMV